MISKVLAPYLLILYTVCFLPALVDLKIKARLVLI